MGVVVILAMFVVLWAVWRYSRPTTINDPGVHRGYVVVNKLTGYPAFDGRLFRTERSAERHIREAAKKDKFGSLFSNWLEVQKFL